MFERLKALCSVSKAALFYLISATFSEFESVPADVEVVGSAPMELLKAWLNAKTSSVLESES